MPRPVNNPKMLNALTVAVFERLELLFDESKLFLKMHKFFREFVLWRQGDR